MNTINLLWQLTHLDIILIEYRITATKRNLRRRQITRKKHGGGLLRFLKRKITQCSEGTKGAQCNPTAAATAAATPSAARNSASAKLARRQAAAERRAIREAKEDKEVDDALLALKKELGLPNRNSNSGSGSPTQKALRKLEREIRKEKQQQPLLSNYN
jgi:hypothetical protein